MRNEIKKATRRLARIHFSPVFQALGLLCDSTAMLLPPEEVLSSLLGSLYDAAADPQLWNAFLQKLGESVQAQCADMLMHDIREQSHTISRYWKIDSTAVQLYHEYYGSKDVWVRGALMAPAGWTGTSEELCTPKEFSNSEFYNDFLLRHGNSRHAMFGIIEKGQYGFSNVSLFRPPSAQPFGPDELKATSVLDSSHSSRLPDPL